MVRVNSGKALKFHVVIETMFRHFRAWERQGLEVLLVQRSFQVKPLERPMGEPDEMGD